MRCFKKSPPHISQKKFVQLFTTMHGVIFTENRLENHFLNKENEFFENDVFDTIFDCDC